ncbi:rRNA-processing protein bfr2 [Malassezia vespertilionis]|nr:rRNA-processing protein bfr2 [Malassezia vespertilionis]WFD05243.1 rRNA-processing protein bfr2 [Malassezia vespertilionis]
MGTSAMRRKARLSESDTLNAEKYRGTRASRAEMFQNEGESSDADGIEDDDDEDDDEDDDIGDIGEDGIDDDEDDEDDEDDDDEIGEDDNLDIVKDDDEDDDDIDEDNDNDHHHITAQDGSMKDNTGDIHTVAAQEENSSVLLGQLHSKQTQDAHKGHQVHKQVRAWERALRIRIAFQKLCAGTSQLPPSNNMHAYLAQAPEAHATLTQAVTELETAAETLQGIRTRLWTDNMRALAPQLNKVGRDTSGSTALADLETTLEAPRRALLARWSNKVAAAPDTNKAGSKLNLRAINQNVVDQLDQALAGDGLQRLLERTRVWRSDPAELLGRDTDESQDAPRDDVFDDSDFYGQLLRDLIDNAHALEAGTAAYASHALQSKKRKRAVDVRASKGRRIRYEVMEKVQNFMPLIPRTLWDDAQSARFFANLAGSTEAAEAEDTEKAAQHDGFRLFA